MEKYTTKEKAIIMQLQWFISLLVVVKCRISCSANQWENHARKRCQVSIKKRALKVCYKRKCYTKLNGKVSVLKTIKIKVQTSMKVREKQHMVMVGNRHTNYLFC
jgi:hypothetical protein